MDGDDGSSSERASGGLYRESPAASDHTDDGGSNGKSRSGQFVHPEPVDQELVNASVDAVVYKKDAWVYARDQKGDWYVARMYAMRESTTGQQIKVHYRGWNTRYDVYLPISKLKVYNGPILDAEKEAETFAVGDFVGARWGGKTFPAKILEFLTIDGEESVNVVFDDGFEKSVRIRTISKLPPAQAAKIDSATFGQKLVMIEEKKSLDDDKQMQELADSNKRVKRKSAGITLKRLTEAVSSQPRTSASATKKSRPPPSQSSRPSKTEEEIVVDQIDQVQPLPECLPLISENPADIERDKKINAQFAVPRGPMQEADGRCARSRRFYFDEERTGQLDNLPDDIVLSPSLKETMSRKRKASRSPLVASPPPAKLVAVQQNPMKTTGRRRSRATTVPDASDATALPSSLNKDDAHDSWTIDAADVSSSSPAPRSVASPSATASPSSVPSRRSARSRKQTVKAAESFEVVTHRRHSRRSMSSHTESVDDSLSSVPSKAAAALEQIPATQESDAVHTVEEVEAQEAQKSPQTSTIEQKSVLSSEKSKTLQVSPIQTEQKTPKKSPKKSVLRQSSMQKEQKTPQPSPAQMEQSSARTPPTDSMPNEHTIPEKSSLSPTDPKSVRGTPLSSPVAVQKSPEKSLTSLHEGQSSQESPLKSPDLRPSSSTPVRSVAAADRNTTLSTPTTLSTAADEKRLKSPQFSEKKLQQPPLPSPAGSSIAPSALLSPTKEQQSVDSSGNVDMSVDATSVVQPRSIADALRDDWMEKPQSADITDSNSALMEDNVGSSAAEEMEGDPLIEEESVVADSLVEQSEDSLEPIGALEVKSEESPDALEESKTVAEEATGSDSRPLLPTADFDKNWLNEYAWLTYDDGFIFCSPCMLFNESKQLADEFTEGFTGACSSERLKAHDESRDHKLATIVQQKENEKKKADASTTVDGVVQSSKVKSSATKQPIVRLKKESTSSEQPPTRKWQVSEKERERVMRKVNEVMIGREDFLVVDGDIVYCKVCRHFASEGSMGNRWARGEQIGSVATVVGHENTAPHRKKMAQYYAQVLKMPMPVWKTGGRLSEIHEIRCSHEGCEKTFRSLDMMGAHVRHSHQQDGAPTTPVVAHKQPTRPALVGHARQSTAGSKKVSSAARPSSSKPQKRKTTDPPPAKKSRVIISTSSSESPDSGSSEGEEDASSNADDYEPENEGKVSSDEAISSDEDEVNVDVDGEDEEQQTDTGSEGDPERSTGRSSVSELGSEDVIRCHCQDNVENGFMLQCDRCKTWQHGDCVGIGKLQTPDLYICFVCVDPPKMRSSRRYVDKVREDYLRDGLLPSFGLTPADETNGPAPMPSRAPIMMRSRMLKSRAIELQDRLRSIKVRMRVGCDPGYLAGLPADARTEAALKTEITQMQDDVEQRLIELTTEISSAERFWYTKFSSIGERESAGAMSKNLLELTKDLKKIKKMALLSR